MDAAPWASLARLRHSAQLLISRAELITVIGPNANTPQSPQPTIYLGDLVDRPELLCDLEAQTPGTTEAMRALVHERMAHKLGGQPALLLDEPDNHLPPQGASALAYTDWANAHGC